MFLLVSLPNCTQKNYAVTHAKYIHKISIQWKAIMAFIKLNRILHEKTCSSLFANHKSSACYDKYEHVRDMVVYVIDKPQWQGFTVHKQSEPVGDIALCN